MGIFDFPPSPWPLFPPTSFSIQLGVVVLVCTPKTAKNFWGCLLQESVTGNPIATIIDKYILCRNSFVSFCATTTVELEQSVGSKKQHKTSEFYWQQKFFCEHFY